MIEKKTLYQWITESDCQDDECLVRIKDVKDKIVELGRQEDKTLMALYDELSQSSGDNNLTKDFDDWNKADKNRGLK